MTASWKIGKIEIEKEPKQKVNSIWGTIWGTTITESLKYCGFSENATIEWE